MPALQRAASGRRSTQRQSRLSNKLMPIWPTPANQQYPDHHDVKLLASVVRTDIPTLCCRVARTEDDAAASALLEVTSPAHLTL